MKMNVKSFAEQVTANVEKVIVGKRGEENALDTLTSAFVEARYSRREFQRQEVNWLQQLWQRLQALLRKR